VLSSKGMLSTPALDMRMFDLLSVSLAAAKTASLGSIASMNFTFGER
jgi:hypothetical protein